jgi:hypothetical protein
MLYSENNVTASEVSVPSGRMAGISDEEREQAREYRKTALKGDGEYSTDYPRACVS